VDQVLRATGGATTKRSGRKEWTPARRLVHQAFVTAATAKGGAFDTPQECTHEEWATAHDELSPLREGLSPKELRAARQARVIAFKRGVDWLVTERFVIKEPKRPVYTSGTA
jgi:hypothetical protein